MYMAKHPRKYVSKTCCNKMLSRTVLKTTSDDNKWLFRELEKLQLKLVILKSHRTFNETCLNNGMLPTYTNIYIIFKIYDIYIYINIYIDLDIF